MITMKIVTKPFALYASLLFIQSHYVFVLHIRHVCPPFPHLIYAQEKECAAEEQETTNIGDFKHTFIFQQSFHSQNLG